mgnify:CR=1 FL=1
MMRDALWMLVYEHDRHSKYLIPVRDPSRIPASEAPSPA